LCIVRYIPPEDAIHSAPQVKGPVSGNLLRRQNSALVIYVKLVKDQRGLALTVENPDLIVLHSARPPVAASGEGHVIGGIAGVASPGRAICCKGGRSCRRPLRDFPAFLRLLPDQPVGAGVSLHRGNDERAR